ncbi:DNA-formamidopyrimidine glycosylase [soil metagenome]
MPELPEVETIRRRLAPLVQGRTLRAMTIVDPRWCEPFDPSDLTDALVGRRVERLERRGKYLIWEAQEEIFLLMHLRMTGTVLYDPAPETSYVRVRFELDDGHTLSFADPRRFGTGELALGHPALEAFFRTRLGIEPLGPHFTSDHLFTLTRGRRSPIKAFLLDQRRIAGVGNIYANEALFRARIHPLRETGKLTRRQVAALHDGVIGALNAGVDAGGASIDDFRQPDGVKGAFQNEFLVHAREREPCLVCGGPIVKFVAAGRGTYACERCQAKPRAARRRS